MSGKGKGKRSKPSNGENGAANAAASSNGAATASSSDSNGGDHGSKKAKYTNGNGLCKNGHNANGFKPSSQLFRIRPTLAEEGGL